MLLDGGSLSGHGSNHSRLGFVGMVSHSMRVSVGNVHGSCRSSVKAHSASSSFLGFVSLRASMGGTGLSSEPGIDGSVPHSHEAVGSSAVFVGLSLEATPSCLTAEGLLKVDSGQSGGRGLLGDDGDGDGSEGKCESHVKLCGSLLIIIYETQF